MEESIAAFIVSPQMFVGFGALVISVLLAGLYETYQGWKDSRRH